MRETLSWMVLAGVVVSSAALARPGAASDQRAAGPQSGSSAPTDPGARFFKTYCASCHGIHGRGDGPVAGEFRKAIPDLTKFTARNGGTFPAERVRQIVDGHGTAAHGDRDMPVWGDAFRSARDGLSPQAVKARIDAIVRYLGAIQERAGH